MRADHELRVALPNVASNFTLAIRFERAGEQNNAVARALENSASGKIMLLRQNFGGRHEGDLASIFDGNDGGLETHDGLARPHITLQQTPHGIRLFHVGCNFLEHALLRGGGMKGQNLLDRRANRLVETKSNSGLCFLLAALQFQSQFDEEQFLEDHADVRRSARGLQIPQALASIRPMDLAERLVRRHQRQALAHDGRNRFEQIGIQVFNRGTDRAPKPARGKASDRFIDRHDATDLQRLSSLFGAVLAGVGGVAQYLELRIADLKLAGTRVLLHFPVQRDRLTELELVLQIGAMKPQAPQVSTSLFQS